MNMKRLIYIMVGLLACCTYAQAQTDEMLVLDVDSITATKIRRSSSK